MKNTFAVALLAGFSLAQNTKNYSGTLLAGGTTGHYGNGYGHGGRDNHDHHDHLYGYDTIKADYDLDPVLEETMAASLKLAIEQA